MQCLALVSFSHTYVTHVEEIVIWLSLYNTLFPADFLVPVILCEGFMHFGKYFLGYIHISVASQMANL